MEQLTLDLAVQVEPNLANFVAGPNQAAIAHLTLWIGARGRAVPRSPVPTYLWGDAGSGKTHLLLAIRQALAERGESAGWLDPSVVEPADFDDHWSVLLLDDVQRYNQIQQHAAFNWFINAQTHQRAIISAGALPATDLAVREDLRTRLGWGHVFQLQVLTEAERKIVLQQRARERGLSLSPDVLDFMLHRFSRDLASLMDLLDQLDQFSLQSQRAVTIPLLKAMLESG